MTDKGPTAPAGSRTCEGNEIDWSLREASPSKHRGDISRKKAISRHCIRDELEIQGTPSRRKAALGAAGPAFSA